MFNTLVILSALFAASSRAAATLSSCTGTNIDSPDGSLTYAPDPWNTRSGDSVCVSANSDFTTFTSTFTLPTNFGNVHAFPHILFNSGLPAAIAKVPSLILSSTWTMAPTAGGDLAATGWMGNVAWDLFLDPDKTAAGSEGTAGYEVMFWLARWGSINPLGAGTPCMTMTLAGTVFNCYCGVNPDHGMQAFSWVATTNVADISFDAMVPINALIKAGKIPSTAYLGLVEHGSEAFYAPVEVAFTVSKFGATVGGTVNNTQASTNATSSSSSSSSSASATSTAATNLTAVSSTLAASVSASKTSATSAAKTSSPAVRDFARNSLFGLSLFALSAVFGLF